MIYFIIYTNVIMQIYYFMSDFLYSKIYFWDSTFAFMSVLVDHSFLCHTLFMKRCSASLKTENSKLKLHRNTVFIYQIGKIKKLNNTIYWWSYPMQNFYTFHVGTQSNIFMKSIHNYTYIYLWSHSLTSRNLPCRYTYHSIKKIHIYCAV